MVSNADSIQEAMNRAGGALPLLRSLDARAHTLPIIAEHTNWQEEQRAWRETCVLMDQSHHMTDLIISGPDALKLVQYLGVNSFEGFAPGKAKQLVVCSPDGFYIGDVILFYLPDGRLNLVGREIVMDWVEFHLQTGSYDAEVVRDENSAVRGSEVPPKYYRFELQGPYALKVLEAALKEPVPQVGFFNMTEFQIAGRNVLEIGRAHV